MTRTGRSGRSDPFMATPSYEYYVSCSGRMSLLGAKPQERSSLWGDLRGWRVVRGPVTTAVEAVAVGATGGCRNRCDTGQVRERTFDRIRSGLSLVAASRRASLAPRAGALHPDRDEFAVRAHPGRSG